MARKFIETFFTFLDETHPCFSMPVISHFLIINLEKKPTHPSTHSLFAAKCTSFFIKIVTWRVHVWLWSFSGSRIGGVVTRDVCGFKLPCPPGRMTMMGSSSATSQVRTYRPIRKYYGILGPTTWPSWAPVLSILWLILLSPHMSAKQSHFLILLYWTVV